MSVLLVEQHASRAIEACDRAYVLESGKVVLSGASRELMDNTQVLAAYIGEA
jgi:branched-chain amino acid transport system ATP-binding protein